MTFKNYLCWNPERVHEVINPDAEAVAEEIFLAIHTDYPLLFSESADRTIALTSISAYDFLHQYFLDSNRGDYVQTMVLGESGSGKSHFIKWINLNIPQQEDTYIFAIPKARTSLRTIIESIVGLLPSNLADPYRQQLKKSDPVTLNDQGKIHYLLSSIALAISQDKLIKNQETDGMEEYLINNLPHLFNDPYLRKSYFTTNHLLINDLISHIFSNRSTNLRAENRREFSASDISLGGRDYASAAFPTQEVLNLIGDGPGTLAFDLALEIINRNLDEALTRTLSLTPQQLINMMTDLRKHLYTQGKRLILLVEDLALLQGIDNTLLQALTIPGRQGNERLCELRWAAAVTTGYYKKLDDTVSTRLTFRIEMDRPAKVIGQEGLAKFAGRYLNAVRIGTERLKTWHQKLQFGENTTPPNACSECQHQSICHQGFGATESYGLYPFNIESLWQMARRVDANITQRLLPRTFLTGVLRQTLHGHADSLAIGQFPTEKLLIGQTKLDMVDRQKLETLDPANHLRRLTLLELWHGKGQIVNLNPIIHEAFSLPVLSNFILEPTPTLIPRPEESPIITRTQPTQPTIPELNELDRWAQGHKMQESLATKLRQVLFDTLWDYIDWDSLSIDRSSIAGRTGAKAFVPLSFRFRGQLTTPNEPSVSIQLPKENQTSNFTKSAIALGGLLQFRNLGHWNFPDGDIALVNALECLQEWAEEIEQQIMALPKVTSEWDPGKAIVELLAIARSLTSAKSEISIDSIMSPESLPTPSMRSNDMDAVITFLSRHHKVLQKLVQAIYSGKKGGQKGRFIYSELILKSLENLQKNKWQLMQSPPTDLVAPYKVISDVYNRIKNSIDKAVINEVNERKVWQSGLITHIGVDESPKDFVQAIIRVRNAMNRVAISGWDINEFDSLQDKFRKANPQQLVKNNTFDGPIEGNKPLQKLALTRKDQMDVVDTFIGKVQNILKFGEQGLANRQVEYSATIKPLDDVKKRIDAAFLTLQTLLEELQ
ncbi:MAG: protein DpdH [Candidatus Competibacter sp.]|nr:protein DpdH [Candidatus Competibacter sp.]